MRGLVLNTRPAHAGDAHNAMTALFAFWHFRFSDSTPWKYWTRTLGKTFFFILLSFFQFFCLFSNIMLDTTYITFTIIYRTFYFTFTAYRINSTLLLIELTGLALGLFVLFLATTLLKREKRKREFK